MAEGAAASHQKPKSCNASFESYRDLGLQPVGYLSSSTTHGIQCRARVPKEKWREKRMAIKNQNTDIFFKM